jgi:hypothetical protein
VRRRSCVVATAILGLGGCLLLPACRAHPDVEPAIPRITDLRATPNPARAGDVVEVTFTAWDAGAGAIAGDWRASLFESPVAGGRLEPDSGQGIRTSPARCATRYVSQAPARASIEIRLTAYGDCDGLFCEVPTNTVTAELSVTVLER